MEQLIKNEIVLLVQARMNSTRLPKKSMIKLGERSVLEHLLLSMQNLFSKVDIVILTSELITNDAIRLFCQENTLGVFSGDEENVASRFYNFLFKNPYEYFVRISGDSPLFDYRLLDDALQTKDDLEIYSTLYEKRFPSGMNFEIFKSSLFLDEYHNFYKKSHFEHVTQYFYENEQNFRIEQIDMPKLPRDDQYNFCIDTMEDKLKLEKILSLMNKEHTNYDLYEKCIMHDKVVKGEFC